VGIYPTIWKGDIVMKYLTVSARFLALFSILTMAQNYRVNVHGIVCELMVGIEGLSGFLGECG
jgi:hypothetical protein